MQRLLSLFLFSFISLPLVSVSGEAAKLVPMEDFFRNPEKTGYQISYNGRYVSFLAPWESRLNIFVEKTNGNPSQITFKSDRDIMRYYWANNAKLVYFEDNGGDENDHMFVIDVNGDGKRDLTPFPGVKAVFIDDLQKDSEHVLVGLNVRDKSIFDAYQVNVNTGELRLVAENPGDVMTWVTDHNGKVRAALATDGVDQIFLYRETENEPFKPVIKTNFKESFEPLAFTYDNKKIYANSNIGRDKSAVVVVDPNTGKEEKVIYENPDVDVYNIMLSDKYKKLVAVSYVTDKLHYVFFDEKTKRMFADFDKQFPGLETRITSQNKEEDMFILRTFSDKTRGAYYLYYTKGKKVKKLADVSSWLDEGNMAEMRPVEYRSRDRLTIHGYLTLPKGLEPKDLPIVVIPHGGPWARDYWSYDPEAQFLANRGYGVLQINYRGSTGYGRSFWEAGFKEWGKAMQDDITDGVQWLIAQGVADPTRIAIYGASYGGYAALAGVTFTPNLYACGVSYVGPSNLFTLLASFPPYWEPLLKQMYEQVGDPIADKKLLEEVSPLFHVEEIKVPLLIAQGANDPRVKQQESDQIVAALKERNLPVEYLLKEDEGHGFVKEENRFDFYRKLESFLEKHLKRN